MAKKIPMNTQQHAVNIVQNFRKMRRDKKHCDFLIKVGSLEIPAHRNILSAASDYFDKMFSHPSTENECGVVELVDVDPECAMICVNHMYGEDVSIIPEKYETLIFVATLMQLHTLCHAITALIADNLDAKSFFVARKISDMYGFTELEEKCKTFAAEHFKLISHEEEFGELEESYIKKMIKSKNVKISERERLDAALNWIKYDSSRCSLLFEMLKLVNLLEIPVQYRRNLIEEDSLIFESRESLRLLSSSVMDSMSVGAGSADETDKAIMIFDKASGHLQLWNPRENTWKKMQEINDDMKKGLFSAVTLSKHIYVLMKSKSVYRLKYLDERGTWQRMADMIEEHGVCPPATVFSNCIYVLGGHNEMETAAVEMYDPLDNEWKKLNDKKQPSKWTHVLTCQGYIYNFGGLTDGKLSDKVERLEPTSSTWIELSPLARPIGYVAAVERRGKIYSLGGFIDGDRFSTVQVYDICDNSWSTMKSMTVARNWHRAYVIGEHMYAVGGFHSSPDSIEKYDFEKQEWKMVEIPSGMKLRIVESCKVSLFH